MQDGDEKFVIPILEREALRLLGQVAAHPLGIVQADLLESEHAQTVVDYVAGILAALYNRGVLSTIVIRDIPGGDFMVAWAVLVTHHHNGETCLQGYGVEPQYLANFNETNLLNMVLESYPELMTVCDPADVPFFEHLGFQNQGHQWFVPNEHFKLAGELFGGRIKLWKGTKPIIDAPVFAFSDHHLDTIQQLARGN